MRFKVGAKRAKSDFRKTTKQSFAKEINGSHVENRKYRLYYIVHLWPVDRRPDPLITFRQFDIP